MFDPKDVAKAVALVGIPYDEKSSFRRGPAEAPDKIRKMLHSRASNFCAESGVDIFAAGLLEDLGNLDVSQYMQIEESIAGFLSGQYNCLTVGGDHSITYPIIKAYHEQYGQVDILHFDAHPDLYDSYDGDPHSHACPFARIMADGLAGRLVQVGIRTLNQHQREQADRFGVEIIEMKDVSRWADMIFAAPLYISIDLDCFDPAFAPGVSHLEPGGLSVRQVIDYLASLSVPVIGADIVEYNPQRDVQDLTAAVAVKLVKELAAKMIESIGAD